MSRDFGLEGLQSEERVLKNNQKICKICLTSEIQPTNNQDNSLFKLIPNTHKIEYCKCQRYVHEECLINWCLLKLTLECPDCIKTYNLEIKKYETKGKNQYFKFLILVFFYILISLTVSVILFSNLVILDIKFSHWKYILGIFIFIQIYPVHYFLRKYYAFDRSDYYFHVQFFDFNEIKNKNDIKNDFKFMLLKLLNLEENQLIEEKANISKFKSKEIGEIGKIAIPFKIISRNSNLYINYFVKLNRKYRNSYQNKQNNLKLPITYKQSFNINSHNFEPTNYKKNLDILSSFQREAKDIKEIQTSNVVGYNTIQKVVLENEDKEKENQKEKQNEIPVKYVNSESQINLISEQEGLNLEKKENEDLNKQAPNNNYKTEIKRKSSMFVCDSIIGKNEEDRNQRQSQTKLIVYIDEARINEQKETSKKIFLAPINKGKKKRFSNINIL